MAQPYHLPPLRLTGASVLRDRQIMDRSVAIADGRITRGPFPAVDLSGYWIFPGIIDLHGDAFERHLAPRPAADFPLPAALAGTDRDAAANGITTAWIAQGWSWEGGPRSPEFAESLLVALSRYRPRSMTDLRVQLRFETHETDSAARLLDVVAAHGVDLVMFNNHIPEALEAWANRPHDVAQWARRGGLTAEQMMENVHAAAARAPDVRATLCHLAEAFDRLNVRYGSHDDPDPATRQGFAAIGARIAEFPTTLAAADAAHGVGDPVLMGAPNVVRGGSQAGNVAAASLIAAGCCDVLVSDYHYPALHLAAFALVDLGLRTLPQAWAMIAETPARIMRLHDRGVIAPGRRADLTVVNKATRAIEATICGGRVSHLSGGAAHRFLAAGQAVQSPAALVAV
jgi:alpha-D-ribose 1-methylphosphonate 5-triphosphate diphosphatase